jgi:hypothetical protein
MDAPITPAVTAGALSRTNLSARTERIPDESVRHVESLRPGGAIMSLAVFPRTQL